MTDDLIAALERKLACRLPDDYRAFLATHTDPLLDRPLVFNPPRSGVIDLLWVSDQLSAYDPSKQNGVPDKSLLFIGENMQDGRLYLKVSKEGLGEVHYMEDNKLRELFPSFGAFLRETHPEDDANMRGVLIY